jgi:hypothetical protein
MVEHCSNHPFIKALSFCHSCRKHFCSDCLEEGVEYYYCKHESCIEARKQELSIHDEVSKSKESESAKIIIDDKVVEFCKRCIEETTSDEISISFFSQSNSKLVNERDRCEQCNSLIMDLRQGIIPGLPFTEIRWSYRIIKTPDLDPGYLRLHREKFISRKLKKSN